MRVIITGGTGLIGQALAENLLADGHEVILLSRHPERKGATTPAGAQVVGWDAETGAGWAQYADGAHAIVNLAGENLAGEGFIPDRWTSAKRRRIRQSRLKAGQAVREAVLAAEKKPALVLQASGSGYYGTDLEAEFSEEDPPGEDFLAQVLVETERSTMPLTDQGVRQVVTRSGVVLSRGEGALYRLVFPFRYFVGGPLGSGRQWLPWVHIEDEVRAMRFLIEQPDASGPYNVVAPQAVRNREFAETLGRVMSRPSFLRVPGWPMRLVLGDVASVVLEGQRLSPRRLQKAGFTYKFPTLEAALEDLLG